MNLPAYLTPPEKIAEELDEMNARMDAPEYLPVERDLAELLVIYQQYRNYLKWLGKQKVTE